MSKSLNFVLTLKNMMKNGLDAAAKQLGGLTGAASKMAGNVGGFFGKLGLASMGLNAAFGAVSKAANFLWGTIKRAFEFEKYKAQFEVLIGSTEGAKKHLQDLAAFAAATPFELPEIAQASKQLMVLTGGIMGGQESLRLVGDAAAVAGQGIGDVAMWVGRAYGAIKAGRPFGEAAMRLQEMGILTADARNKMEDLQKSGAPAAEVFAVLQGSLDATAGGMDRLSQTGDGLMSTLNDTWNATLRKVGETFQDTAKDKIASLIEWLEYLQETKLDGWIEGIMNVLGKAGKALGWLKDRVQDVGAFFGTLAGGGSLDDAMKAGDVQRTEEAQKKAEWDKRKASEKAAAKAKQKETAAAAAADFKNKLAADLGGSEQTRLDAAKKATEAMVKASPQGAKALAEVMKSYKGKTITAAIAEEIKGKLGDEIQQQEEKAQKEAQDRMEKIAKAGNDLEEAKYRFKFEGGDDVNKARMTGARMDQLKGRIAASKDPLEKLGLQKEYVEQASILQDLQKAAQTALDEKKPEKKKAMEARSLSLGDLYEKRYGQEVKKAPEQETADNTKKMVLLLEEIKKTGGLPQ